MWTLIKEIRFQYTEFWGGWVSDWPPNFKSNKRHDNSPNIIKDIRSKKKHTEITCASPDDYQPGLIYLVSRLLVVKNHHSDSKGLSLLKSPYKKKVKSRSEHQFPQFLIQVNLWGNKTLYWMYICIITLAIFFKYLTTGSKLSANLNSFCSKQLGNVVLKKPYTIKLYINCLDIIVTGNYTTVNQSG